MPEIKATAGLPAPLLFGVIVNVVAAVALALVLDGEVLLVGPSLLCPDCWRIQLIVSLSMDAVATSGL